MRRCGCLLASVLWLLAGAGGALADPTYPNRAIRVLIPYAPGLFSTMTFCPSDLRKCSA